MEKKTLLKILNFSGKKYLLIISILIAASLACSLPFVGNSPDSGVLGENQQSDNQPIEEPVENLRCQLQGYPCTYEGTPEEKIKRSLELMDIADDVFARAGNVIAVAERLLEENDMAEMYYDERGVWYRLEDSPPFIFLHPEAFTIEVGEEISFSEHYPGSRGLLSPHVPEPDGPVGINPPGEKVTKKALFISPFAWQFGSDLYDSVTALLLEQRDYRCEGCVQYLSDTTNAKDLINEDISSAGSTYEQFLGWKDYDLIHVFSHGYQFCPGQSVTSSGQPVVSGDREDIPENTAGVFEGTNVSEGECVTIIQTGHYQTREHLQENPSDIAGVAWFHKPGVDTWGELVTTDFFKSQYPGGLDDTILFFTSCQLFRDMSLANALRGTNTAVFGWTDTVSSNRGKATAIQFFTELIENGLRSSISYEKTTDSESHTEHSENWHGAQLKMSIDHGSDPRGREVITLMQPIYREELEDLDAVPTIGTAGDGENDELLFLVQIDGIDEEQNPDDFVIHIAVDGEEVDETFKPTEKINEYSYWTLDVVPLPFDAADRDYVELEVWVELPEGGESRHFLKEVELANCGWTGKLSGSRSGQIEGDIVFPSIHLSAVDINRLSFLAGEGYLGSMGEDGSGVETLADLPRSVMMGSREQFPFLMVIPGQAANAMLEENSLGIGGPQTSVNLSEETEQRVEGSFSAELTELATQQKYSIQGDLIWHVDSFCSMDVMMELVENPLPAGMAP